jgi:hypothetical protein
MTKLIDAFRKSANVPRNGFRLFENRMLSRIHAQQSVKLTHSWKNCIMGFNTSFFNKYYVGKSSECEMVST